MKGAFFMPLVLPRCYSAGVLSFHCLQFLRANYYIWSWSESKVSV